MVHLRLCLMPVLSNPRHERFAQELAKGKSASEAYVAAGYSDNRHNAAALAREQHISTRVAELQERGAKRVEVTVETILAELAEDRELARQHKQVGAAVAASMGRAKVAGLIVEKREVRTGELDELASDEREQLREALRRELEGRVGGTGQDKPRKADRGLSAVH